jgi:RNA polymerase sigma-70 factor (ECF subfamily)
MPGDTPPTEIDAETLALCRAHAPGAMETFVKTYQRRVFSVLSRMLGHGPHVEDAAQETFIRAFKAIPNFDVDGSGRVSTWLLTIAIHLAMDGKRKDASRPPSIPMDDADGELCGLATQATPEQHYEQRERCRQIAAAFEELSREQQSVLVLAVEGLTYQEIADALKIPESTVRARLHGAREGIRQRLGGVRMAG